MHIKSFLAVLLFVWSSMIFADDDHATLFLARWEQATPLKKYTQIRSATRSDVRPSNKLLKGELGITPEELVTAYRAIPIARNIESYLGEIEQELLAPKGFHRIPFFQSLHQAIIEDCKMKRRERRHARQEAWRNGVYPERKKQPRQSKSSRLSSLPPIYRVVPGERRVVPLAPRLEERGVMRKGTPFPGIRRGLVKVKFGRDAVIVTPSQRQKIRSSLDTNALGILVQYHRCTQQLLASSSYQQAVREKVRAAESGYMDSGAVRLPGMQSMHRSTHGSFSSLFKEYLTGDGRSSNRLSQKVRQAAYAKPRYALDVRLEADTSDKKGEKKALLSDEQRLLWRRYQIALTVLQDAAECKGGSFNQVANKIQPIPRENFSYVLSVPLDRSSKSEAKKLEELIDRMHRLAAFMRSASGLR